MTYSAEDGLRGGRGGIQVIINRTELAMISLGIDSETAASLRKGGLTLAKLQALPDSELASAGLSSAVIHRIRSRGRPPIPVDDLVGVLFANRYLCCVCRDVEKPVVIHHIEPWEQSRSHAQSNLAVLCLHHHEEAHTRRDLTLTLDPVRLRKLKAQWEDEVGHKDADAILEATKPRSDQWLYFNHVRLFDLARDVQLEVTSLAGYTHARDAGLCDEDGTVTAVARPGSYMYEGIASQYLYRYVKNVLEALLEHYVIRNISDFLERGLLGHGSLVGQLVFVQGAHSFAACEGPPTSQFVRGTRKANGVEISFVFDRAEATSCSAWSNWLCGRQVAASLLHVKRIESTREKLTITGTVLAIGFANETLKKRRYDVRLFQSGIPYQYDVEGPEDELADFDEQEHSPGGDVSLNG